LTVLLTDHSTPAGTPCFSPLTFPAFSPPSSVDSHTHHARLSEAHIDADPPTQTNPLPPSHVFTPRFHPSRARLAPADHHTAVSKQHASGSAPHPRAPLLLSPPRFSSPHHPPSLRTRINTTQHATPQTHPSGRLSPITRDRSGLSFIPPPANFFCNFFFFLAFSPLGLVISFPSPQILFLPPTAGLLSYLFTPFFFTSPPSVLPPVSLLTPRFLHFLSTPGTVFFSHVLLPLSRFPFYPTQNFLWLPSWPSYQPSIFFYPLVYSSSSFNGISIFCNLIIILLEP